MCAWDGCDLQLIIYVKQRFVHVAHNIPVSSLGSINFLHADCEKFRHPLLHIQKTPADCPVIAIDSFRHMYVFPEFKDLT